MKVYLHEDFLDEDQMVEEVSGEAVLKCPDLGHGVNIVSIAQDEPLR